MSDVSTISSLVPNVMQQFDVWSVRPGADQGFRKSRVFKYFQLVSTNSSPFLPCPSCHWKHEIRQKIGYKDIAPYKFSLYKRILKNVEYLLLVVGHGWRPHEKWLMSLIEDASASWKTRDVGQGTGRASSSWIFRILIVASTTELKFSVNLQRFRSLRYFLCPRMYSWLMVFCPSASPWGRLHHASFSANMAQLSS